VCQQALAADIPKEAKVTFEAYLKAIDEYLRSVRDPEKVNQVREECLSRLKKVLALRDAGKYKEAEKELQEASKLSPGGEWLYRTLCNLGAGTVV